MKNLKLIIAIAAIATTSIATIFAMEERPPQQPNPVDIPFRRVQHIEYSWEEHQPDIGQARLRELEELRERREIEKMAMKPATKIFGISVLNQLMRQESDEARSALLNGLPIELKESLISLIDDRRQLLDRNQPDEAALVEDLNTLQKQIQQNLSQ